MQCKHVKNDGSQCEAQALEDNEYCFQHNTDPKVSVERHEARVRGGKEGRLQLKLKEEDISVKTIDDVIGLLEETINDVRCGRMPANRANSVGYLANLILKALEQRDVEHKLVVLEKTVLGDR